MDKVKEEHMRRQLEKSFYSFAIYAILCVKKRHRTEIVDVIILVI